MDGGDFLSYIWRGAVIRITFGCIVLILLTESNFGIFTSDGDVGGSYWIPWTAGSFSEIFFFWESSAPFGNRDVCDLLQPVGQILSSESKDHRVGPPRIYSFQPLLWSSGFAGRTLAWAPQQVWARNKWRGAHLEENVQWLVFRPD